MAKKYVTVFLLLHLMACTYSGKDIHTVEEMSSILLELHLAESFAQQLPHPEGSELYTQTDSLKHYYNDIFLKYNSNNEKFKRSISYYKNKPELLDSVYQQIISEIHILNEKQSAQ